MPSILQEKKLANLWRSPKCRNTSTSCKAVSWNRLTKGSKLKRIWMPASKPLRSKSVTKKTRIRRSLICSTIHLQTWTVISCWKSLASNSKSWKIIWVKKVVRLWKKRNTVQCCAKKCRWRWHNFGQSCHRSLQQTRGRISWTSGDKLKLVFRISQVSSSMRSNCLQTPSKTLLVSRMLRRRSVLTRLCSSKWS